MTESNSLNGRKFDNILNFRDVGEYINQETKSSILRPGLLFRSARPDEASPADRRRLIEDYKIHTVVDLRSKTEHIQAANRHSVRLRTASPLAPTNAAAANPIKIPGLAYSEISLNGHAFSMALMRKLPILSSAKLISLMALGYREAAISILGTQVMAPRGLIGLAIDSLTYCTAEIYAVFAVLADTKNWPVICHCTQGKDRTGLTILLLLMLCGVNKEVIKVDYTVSQTELAAEREEKLVEIRSIGLPDYFADCDENWVDGVCQFVETEYGDVENYLERCGVTKSMRESIKGTLMA